MIFYHLLPFSHKPTTLISKKTNPHHSATTLLSLTATTICNTMLTPPPDSSASSFTHLLRTTLSYDTNVMLAAIISLLLVILFVLLLHLYARWFLVQARQRSRTSVAVPAVLGSRLHHRFTIIDTTTTTFSDSPTPKRGLPSSIIASLPLFIYKFLTSEDPKHGLECAICISFFEEDEIGRKLPVCGHAFHVECIDMWLHSHSTCPICRAAIRYDRSHKFDDHVEIDVVIDEGQGLSVDSDQEELELEILSIENDQMTDNYHENANVVVEINDSGLGCSSSSSSSLGASLKRLLSSSSSSLCGGKIHPTDVNGGVPEA